MDSCLIVSLRHSKYNMCIKYMPFYTVFITKGHFQIFGEMVQKTLKMKKCHLFLVYHVCMLMAC